MKKPDPTFEELEFIFERVGRLSDSEIREELQETRFPLRGIRFLKQRRLHYDVAKKVLRAELEKEIDPLVVEKRREHSARLSDIAQELSSGYGVIKENPPQDDESEPTYTLADYLPPVSSDEFRSMIQRSIERVWGNPLTIRFGDEDFTHVEESLEFFLCHLRAEFPDIQAEPEWLSTVVREKPYELIRTLKLVAMGRGMNGKCPLCKDW